MKKRFNPIPIGIVGILCAVLVVFMQIRSQPPDAAQPNPQTQIADSHQVVGNKTSAPSRTDLSKDIKVGGSPTPPASAIPGGAHGMPPGMDRGGKFPAPPNHPVKPMKPMPNDSSISTQWYTDETNKTAGHS